MGHLLAREFYHLVQLHLAVIGVNIFISSCLNLLSKHIITRLSLTLQTAVGTGSKSLRVSSQAVHGLRIEETQDNQKNLTKKMKNESNP